MAESVSTVAWRAPLDDLRFVIADVVGWDRYPSSADGGFDRALTDDILAEAGRFAEQRLAPLDAVADRAGVQWKDGRVTTAPGMVEAWQAFCANGWNALDAPVESGGQALPHLLACAVEELWAGANLSFSLAPMLTSALAATLVRHGSPQQRALWLPRLVSGEWTGAMNLTEPQAGSDLSAVRTRAVAEASADSVMAAAAAVDNGAEGDAAAGNRESGNDAGQRYRLFGTKIYITWGEHDLTGNIVHLVLARTADAPPGVKGLSLFIVPSVLVDERGGLLGRNDVRCVSVEHKLGLHGCPTAVMAFGDGEGALGWRLGEAHRGLEYMFTMMNRARLAVGVEGVGLSERAFQLAHRHALERVQGRAIGTDTPRAVPIIEHPDVRRMLLSMRVSTEAGRAFALQTAMLLDASQQDAQAMARLELFTPIVKGWCTEQAVLNASTGIQVHGGMGYIEATGAAQVLRDARITPIYEGTTAIQANDLLWRKLRRDDGVALNDWLAEVDRVAAAIGACRFAHAMEVSRALAAASAQLTESVGFLLRFTERDPAGLRECAAAAVSLLELSAVVASGWMMARSAIAAESALARGDPRVRLLARKLDHVRFHASTVLPMAGLFSAQIRGAGEAILSADLSADY